MAKKTAGGRKPATALRDTHVWLTPEERDALVAFATKNRRSISAQAAVLITEGIKRAETDGK